MGAIIQVFCPSWQRIHNRSERRAEAVGVPLEQASPITRARISLFVMKAAQATRTVLAMAHGADRCGAGGWFFRGGVERGPISAADSAQWRGCELYSRPSLGRRGQCRWLARSAVFDGRQSGGCRSTSCLQGPTEMTNALPRSLPKRQRDMRVPPGHMIAVQGVGECAVPALSKADRCGTLEQLCWATVPGLTPTAGAEPEGSDESVI